jgi:phospholipase D
MKNQRLKQQSQTKEHNNLFLRPFKKRTKNKGRLYLSSILLAALLGFGAHDFLKYDVFKVSHPVQLNSPAVVPQVLLNKTSPQLNIHQDIDVCFTPEQSCVGKIVDHIDSAQSHIFVHCYSFTSKNIAHALVRAKKRGIAVKMISDISQKTAHHSQAQLLEISGIPVVYDIYVKIAHSKVMIIDGKIVITGSYNWTEAAEKRNAENLLIIKNLPLAKIYEDHFMNRYRKCL